MTPKYYIHHCPSNLWTPENRQTLTVPPRSSATNYREIKVGTDMLGQYLIQNTQCAAVQSSTLSKPTQRAKLQPGKVYPAALSLPSAGRYNNRWGRKNLSKNYKEQGKMGGRGFGSIGRHLSIWQTSKPRKTPKPRFPPLNWLESCSLQ